MNWFSIDKKKADGKNKGKNGEVNDSPRNKELLGYAWSKEYLIQMEMKTMKWEPENEDS